MWQDLPLPFKRISPGHVQKGVFLPGGGQNPQSTPLQTGVGDLAPKTCELTPPNPAAVAERSKPLRSPLSAAANRQMWAWKISSQILKAKFEDQLVEGSVRPNSIRAGQSPGGRTSSSPLLSATLCARTSLILARHQPSLHWLHTLQSWRRALLTSNKTFQSFIGMGKTPMYLWKR